MMDATPLLDRVINLVRLAAEREVMPRFRALADGDVREKSPGELVTVADVESERFLTPRLRQLLDVPVIGEEAAAEDERVLTHTRTLPDYWVVDPVDGTTNFARGNEHFAVMVGLVRDGRPVLGCILHPTTGALYTALAGGGAWCNGERLHCAAVDGNRPRGVVEMPASRRRRRQLSAAVDERLDIHVPMLGSAGWEYPRVARNDIDFCYFRGTYPWDHVPGALLVSEAGGTTRRLDGSPYDPSLAGKHMIAAVSDEVGALVRTLVFGAES